MATITREPTFTTADPGQRAAANGAPRRISHVDGLRGLAALWVAIYHAQLGFLPHWDSGPVAVVFGAGSLGVAMFLVLSGFCLTYPLVARGRTRVELRSFAIRRAMRILPPYYIVMFGLAGLQLVPMVAERTARQLTDGPDLLAHLFLVHNLWPSHAMRISGPFWSIALEFQLYLLFPLLLLLVRRPRTLMLGALAVAGAWWLAAPHLLGSASADAPLGTTQGDAFFTYWSSLPSMLPLFVAGMVAAWALIRPRRFPAWTAAAGAGLLAAAVILDRSVAWPMPGRLLAGAGTGLILLLPVGRIGRFLGWRPLVRLGEASYTLYLVHFALMSPMWELSAGRLHGSALVLAEAVAVSASVGVALVLSKLIEQPFHKLARRLAGAPERVAS